MMTEKEMKELSYKDTTELLDVDKATLLDIIECLHYDIRRNKERTVYLERSNNRREEMIVDLQNEQQLDMYKNTLIKLRNQIEHIRQYFDDNLQADFVLLLEIIDKAIPGEKAK